MFAVIKTGGKQYRVAVEDVIRVDHMAGEPGDIVEFGDVLMLGGDNVTVGTPTIAGATVAGELLQHTRGDKVIAFKKRRRKNSRRKRGYRHDFSVIRITEILTDGQKPTKTARSEPQLRRPAAKPAEEAAEAESAPASAKTSAKKPAARAKSAAAAKAPARSKAESGKDKGKSKAPSKKK
ncbi:MAG TPA: 50S ribosomal protein L21 [Xanthobacteraceae bacterium]|nr:50S ribosomal protein L21 [Xanthobacteraceae bacterium]